MSKPTWLRKCDEARSRDDVDEHSYFLVAYSRRGPPLGGPKPGKTCHFFPGTRAVPPHFCRRPSMLHGLGRTDGALPALSVRPGAASRVVRLQSPGGTPGGTFARQRWPHDLDSSFMSSKLMNEACSWCQWLHMVQKHRITSKLAGCRQRPSLHVWHALISPHGMLSTVLTCTAFKSDFCAHLPRKMAKTARPGRLMTPALSRQPVCLSVLSPKPSRTGRFGIRMCCVWGWGTKKEDSN